MAEMTKREKFEAIADVLGAVEGAEDLVAFAQKEAEALKARAEKPRKMTKTQLENEAFKEVVLEMLEGVDEGMTATEVAGALGVTPQRAVPILKKLVAAEAVTRLEGKGKEKTRFILA